MAQFKVVITDYGSPENEIERQTLSESELDIELIRLNGSMPEALAPHISDVDALIVQWETIDRDTLEKLEKCRVISRYGIGVDMIDLQAAGERGIMVCNVPDYCIEEVSAHTLMFMLMLNRRALAQHARVQGGKWGPPPGGAPRRLSRTTAGVIGLGRIGREVARLTQAYGMSVIAFDPYTDEATMREIGVKKSTFSDLLAASDFICVHCPLNEETRHLIDADQFALMKNDAYIINMARGPVVNQRALVAALSDHAIAGAALDVFEQEPIPPDDPLLKLDNVIFSPHLSSWSTEAQLELRRQVAHNVALALDGQQPPSIVNRNYLST